MRTLAESSDLSQKSPQGPSHFLKNIFSFIALSSLNALAACLCVFCILFGSTIPYYFLAFLVGSNSFLSGTLLLSLLAASRIDAAPDHAFFSRVTLSQNNTESPPSISDLLAITPLYAWPLFLFGYFVGYYGTILRASFAWWYHHHSRSLADRKSVV